MSLELLCIVYQEIDIHSSLKSTLSAPAHLAVARGYLLLRTPLSLLLLAAAISQLALSFLSFFGHEPRLSSLCFAFGPLWLYVCVFLIPTPSVQSESVRFPKELTCWYVYEGKERVSGCLSCFVCDRGVL